MLCYALYKLRQILKFILFIIFNSTAIAQSLAQATHFNTFGGNPVACAAGSAVLEVLKCILCVCECVCVCVCVCV